MRFKEAREAAGLTVLQAARKLALSTVAVYKWEDGRSVPEGRRMLDIAKLYGCTVDDLLRDESNPKSDN